MKWPRPRITVRRLMVAVAVVGLVLAFEVNRRRRARFLKAAVDHFQTAFWVREHLRIQIEASDPSSLTARDTSPGDREEAKQLADLIQDRLAYHLRMQAKSEAAARRPWLAVEPDPPAPGSISWSH